MQIKIVQIERNLPEGLCTTVHWTASKTDGEYTAYAYGTLALPAKDPSDPTFIPYDQITEAQVIEWVKKAMGKEQLAELEASLDRQIKEQKYPTQDIGLPWEPEEDMPEDEDTQSWVEVTEEDE